MTIALSLGAAGRDDTHDGPSLGVNNELRSALMAGWLPWVGAVLAGVMGGGGLVAWVRSPSTIRKTNVEAAGRAVEALLDSLNHVTNEVAELRVRYEQLAEEYERCETHRVEQTAAIAHLQEQVDRLSSS